MSEKRSNRMPKGIPYIVGNEAAERFSYYGMKAILFTFMTQYMVDSTGAKDTVTPTVAQEWIHTFGSGVYFFPIIGAFVSDIFWGKYKTIIILSILYCCGHIALALDETQTGLLLGLTMIAIGSGGIKPCVSAHVGDQFTKTNAHLVEKVFYYFYFAINVGAAIAQIFTRILLDEVGPWLAFGLPGGLMILATIVFWFGRTKFIAVPPKGWTQYKREVFSKEGIDVIKKLLFLFSFVTVFWSLFDQTASSIIKQATSPLVDKSLFIFDLEIKPDQVQAANPIMVLILIPLFSIFIYPWIDKNIIKLTPLVKVNIGMFIAALSFLIIVFIQIWIDNNQSVSIYWQFLAYLILTMAEIMVSITLLEFSYTQAPFAMKSLVMGINLLAVSGGNLITALFNKFIQDENGNSIISDVTYFAFFSGLMLVAALGFIYVVKNYKEKTYIHDEGDDTALVLE